MPAISVIMPVYNSENYVKDAIQSILDQTFTDFEFLIYNDGSTDKTDAIINEFKDERIVYRKVEQNAGFLNLLNEGLATAKGKYIARMDADDISLSNRFEEQYKYLEEHADVGICGSWLEFIGIRSGKVKMPVSFDDVCYSIFFNSPVCHPSSMMRISDLNKFQLRYNPDYYFAEDYKLFSESIFCFKVVNLPLVLLKYRSHPQQVSSIKWRTQFSHRCTIQTTLFSKCILQFSNSDFDWLYNFFSENSIPTDNWLLEVEEYKSKIIQGNCSKGIFSQKILEKAVHTLFKDKLQSNFYRYYFNKYYNKRKYSPSLLFSFLREKYKPHRVLGAKTTLYFVLKCLMGYSKKTTISY